MLNSKDKLTQLIKILESTPEITCPNLNDNKNCDGCKYKLDNDKCDIISRKVDYLINNGVYAFPCNIGDDIYITPKYGGRTLGMLQKDKIQMIGVTSRGIHIKARNNHDHNKMYMLNNGAFLNKADANKYIKGE